MSEIDLSLVFQILWIVLLLGLVMFTTAYVTYSVVVSKFKFDIKYRGRVTVEGQDYRTTLIEPTEKF